MSVWNATLSPRHSGAAVCCPSCRSIQESGPECIFCGESGSALIPLLRGLASLADRELDDGHGFVGLIRYPGDRVVTWLALGLALLFPAAGIVALAANGTAPASLLGLCLIALPALAFIDAQRAGERSTAPATAPPGLSPESARPAEPRNSDSVRRAPFRGIVRRVEQTVAGPVSQQVGLTARCDIRAGKHGRLLARQTHGAEFLVESDDGTAVLVAGQIELDAAAYGAVLDAGQVTLDFSGVKLLPASFDEGGWACELLLRDGDSVEVYAELGGEMRSHPLGASYRNTGAIQVLRGVSGRPLRVRIIADAFR
ncbi:MAG: hypothetical protein MJE77_14655 [Proteobacteria bacterium]|nr:hypothetical protein [Pseudomonadota bacterium]